MKSLNYLKNIATSLILLVITIPFVLAYDYDLTYDGNGNLVTGDGFYREYSSGH